MGDRRLEWGFKHRNIQIVEPSNQPTVNSYIAMLKAL